MSDNSEKCDTNTPSNEAEDQKSPTKKVLVRKERQIFDRPDRPNAGLSRNEETEFT